MRYIGGKGRIAKPLAAAILAATPNRSTYIEPFIGGAAVFEQLAPEFLTAFGSDLQPDIVALWRGIVHEGFEPPDHISLAEYETLRTSEPSALRGLVGFGGSFGGKFFGGYARGGFNGDLPRNHYGESRRAALRLRALDPLRVDFAQGSFERWRPLRGDVVYCDPPYSATQGYSTGDFDTTRFWDVMYDWRNAGAFVFVSEYKAPWPCIWELNHRQSLTMPAQGRGLVVERLFHLPPEPFAEVDAYLAENMPGVK